MTSWSYFNPVRLQFGEGGLDDIGTLVAGRPYLLVTHPDVAMLGWREQLIERAGAPLLTIDEIEPNPSLAMLRPICERAAAIGGARLIVALGGGSVIDTAKFLAAGHGQFDPVLAYIEEARPRPRASLPFIAIPTTAGTGSDLTKWATIWDPASGRKLSLNHDDLYAETALVDPLITATLPWSMTLASGLDALSHALESIWNVNASPVTRSYAVAAATDLMAGLTRLKADIGDRSARSRMALGAAKAGLAFSNTQTALAHNISYPITLEHGVTHGIACSFCLPEVMTAALGVDGACDAALGAIFGVSAPTKLRGFLDALGVPSTPGSFGIGTSRWREIVDLAFAGPRGRNFIGRRTMFPMTPALAD